MRYVPDLIAKKWKVLPTYFTGTIYQARKTNPLLTIAGWILGLLLLFMALVSLNHPLLAIVFGLLGFILLPPGHRWLEKTLHFRFTGKIKAAVGGLLFTGALPLTAHYSKIDAADALVARQQAEVAERKAQQAKLVAEKKEKQRQDSLTFYIQKSASLAAAHKPDLALHQLDHATVLVTTASEETQVKAAQSRIASGVINGLIKAGRYQAAIPKLGALLALDGANADLLYERAACYSHVGNIRLAVGDCKAAMASGNKQAARLYDKINPVRRYVAYYVTRCCDGSTSGATGRGACSHHGGVCNWQDPVYEESRKYE